MGYFFNRVSRSANNNGRGRPRVVRVTISPLKDVKHSLVARGDIAGDVAFQNDVNALLAAVSRLPPAGAGAEDQRPVLVRDPASDPTAVRRARP
jgi:hypothetical protein